MIRNKTIKFDMGKPEDRELWNFLSALEHGEFSTATKSFWRTRMSFKQHEELNDKMDMLDRFYDVANRYEKGEKK